MKRSLLRTLPAMALLGLSVALVGCESDGSDDATTMAAVSMGAINDTCPIMGSAVDPNAASAEFAGATIGFCCDGCVGKWNNWSDAQKRDYVTKNQ